MKTKKLLGSLAASSLVLLPGGMLRDAEIRLAGPGLTGPIGATITDEARGLSATSGSLAINTGEAIVTELVTIDPGGIVGWHNATNRLLIVTEGSLTSYTACDNKQAWTAGEGYVHKGSLMLKNEGSGPAAFYAVLAGQDAVDPATNASVVSKAIQDCPVATSKVSRTELGRGTAYRSATIAIDQGTQIVAQRVILEPGYNTGWHQHPDNTVVLHLNGELNNYLDCNEKEVWKPGYAYPHLNSQHHSGHPNLTKNEAASPSESVFVFFNVPAEQPAPMTPISPAAPPAECPTMT